MIDQESNPEIRSSQPPPQTSTKNSRYTFTMGILFLIYIAMGLIYYFFPSQLFYLANLGTKIFSSTQPIPDTVPERFWSFHTVILAFLLAMISLFSAQSPSKKGLPFLHFLTKAAMASGFIYLFYTDRPLFIYCLGAGMETLIALVLLWNIIRMTTQRS